MSEGEEGRFREPKTVYEERELVKKAIPSSTKYKNKWAVTMSSEWHDLHKVAQLSSRIEEMFVMEVAKKSGERCPPKTVYGIDCGIRRY